MMIRSLLTLAELSGAEVRGLIEASLAVKRGWEGLVREEPLRGKVVLLYFELPSTRTRLSFESAAVRLGAGAIYLRERDLQVSRGEPLSDTARVLSAMSDVVVARVRSHARLVELAEHSSVPVVNALTDMYHPTQALTDLMTMLEVKGRLRGLRVAYVGDGCNNVCHSLLIACSKVGADISVASPPGYEPDPEVLEVALRCSRESGSEVRVLSDPAEAVRGADVVYTDVFVSMGREAERERRMRDFAGWQVDRSLISRAKEDYIFMHCLPAHRGEEVAGDVIDDEEHSVVWLQAANKMYVAAALLLAYCSPASLRRLSGGGASLK